MYKMTKDVWWNYGKFEERRKKEVVFMNGRYAYYKNISLLNEILPYVYSFIYECSMN